MDDVCRLRRRVSLPARMQSHTRWSSVLPDSSVRVAEYSEPIDGDPRRASRVSMSMMAEQVQTDETHRCVQLSMI